MDSPAGPALKPKYGGAWMLPRGCHLVERLGDRAVGVHSPSVQFFAIVLSQGFQRSNSQAPEHLFLRNPKGCERFDDLALLVGRFGFWARHAIPPPLPA